MKKNNIYLLFKNAIKQAFRNKIQLIGLVVLVLLSSTIFSLMQTSIARVNNEYNALISEKQSNIHDFVFDPYNTVKLTSAPPAPTPPPNPPAGSLEEQQLYLNEVANGTNNKFIWDRVEARTVQLNNNNDPKVLKLITYNQYARIDKLVISQGYNIGENPNIKTPKEKQVVINKEFAEKNKLKIGDIIRVYQDNLGDTLKVINQDINNPENNVYNWLQIVGYGNSADFITPIIDQSTPLPNKLKEGILYVDPLQFGLSPLTNTNNNTLWYYNKGIEKITISSNADAEIYYVGKWTTKEHDINIISQYFKERYVNISDSTAKLVYLLGDGNYRFNSRTATLPSTTKGFTTLLISLLLIVLIITGITVLLITYKNIDNTKPQIGILKSLGYSNWKILITSLAYPMMASLIGTILVFLPASGLQILVVNTFANYFNLNFGSFVFDGLGYLYCLILTFGFLSLIAWIISALTVIKNPITLINNISASRDSKFTKFVKKTSAHRAFLTRFRLALFTSSIGKMAAVSLTMFLGTVLMTSAIIGPKIMSDNELVSYTGMNYQSLVEYVNPTYNSPFSFYKTYNPKAIPWEYETTEYDQNNSYVHPKRTDQQYVQELLNNNINPEAYAPIAPDPSEPSSLFDLSMQGLTYLYGKMMTKSFLNGLDESKGGSADLMPIILGLAWPEGQPIFDIAQQQNSGTPLYSDANYQTVRIFYNNYRSTIDMNINPEARQNANPKQLDKSSLANLFSSTNAWQADASGFASTLSAFNFDYLDQKYPLHIENEKELLVNPTQPDTNIRDNWIRKTMIWYYALFYNRIGQTVAQGAYTKYPYFIKQNVAKAFEDPKAQFNVSFNTIPFNKQTDELGTYFIGTPKQQFNNRQYPIKVYGLQNERQLGRASFMQLYDTNGNALNSVLERTNVDDSINIVINQTIAKQLHMKENQTFMMSTNGNIMMTNQDTNNPGKYVAIDIDQIDFSGIASGNPATQNNANLFNQQTVYQQIPSTSDGAYPNLGTAPAPMLNEVSQGNVVINHNNDFKKFKVAGIYNGYGQPAAYILKSNADELLGFNQSKKAFYGIFKEEWQDKGSVNGIDFSYLQTHTYEQFKDDTTIDLLKTVFNNEFPVFNFKFSTSNDLPDITQSFSVSQDYGDYSNFGMNGGTTTENVSYQGYGQGTAVNVLPLHTHKQLLDQITQLVNTILLFFIIFSLVISFFIILITSDLVIYENKKVIATMKTLGYSDAKITNIVIGMYLPVIAAMFIIGFPIGLVIVQSIINYLAYNTTWVLPFFFTWWIPIVVGLIVLGIYAITFVIEWYAMKRISILKVLNETN